MKREIVEAWWATQFPGETLLGFVPVSSSAGPGDGTSAGKAPFTSVHHGPLRGLDDDVRLVLWDRLVLFLFTETHLHVATSGGLFRVRPKELRHSIAREGLQVQWFDYSELKTGWRNFLIQIPDGTWMGVAAATMILGRDTKATAGAQDFLAWIGPTAVEIDWRNPPPLA